MGESERHHMTSSQKDPKYPTWPYYAFVSETHPDLDKYIDVCNAYIYISIHPLKESQVDQEYLFQVNFNCLLGSA